MQFWLLAIKLDFFFSFHGGFLDNFRLRQCLVFFLFLYNNNLYICRMQSNMLRFMCQTTSKDVFNWLPFCFSLFGVSATTVVGV